MFPTLDLTRHCPLCQDYFRRLSTRLSTAVAKATAEGDRRALTLARACQLEIQQTVATSSCAEFCPLADHDDLLAVYDEDETLDRDGGRRC
jgi:hypothetical protein